ncbi:MAG: von Willebrand factor type A domain-containing protein [Dysgonamonadaceae bacterium]|nr:von Willebrand factor type A domain-containing protein [Dysgonamonadaceae bacterium]
MKKVKLLLVLGSIFLGTTALFSQRMTVTGKVTDAGNQPLIGVSVMVKGTNSGVATDFEGSYRIQAQREDVLVFSYVGYLTREIRVERSIHNVGLEENMAVLEEMVVIGMGRTERRVASLSPSIPVTIEVMEAGSFYSSPVSVSYDAFQAEEYNSFSENRFQSARENPLSTFSLDVNTASYSNIRRMINQGQMPPKDAVRIEEMINYFNYEYPNTTGEHPVSFTTEMAICPWNEQHRIVRIGVKAKEIPNEDLPQANLVFLIDVSGSMSSANRLPLVKSSLKMLLNNLRDIDRVAIVTYANNVREVLPSTPASDKQKIIDAIDGLVASGGTAGGDGIQRAYRIAEQNFIRGGNNRIVLATDGDFNIGISNPRELENFIETKRRTGVFLTVLGYGMGNLKDNRLQILSEKGNGNYAYIDNIQEAYKVLVHEFGGTMYTVAKDVKIQVEFNPAHVNAYRLVGYESRMLNKEDFNDDTKDAGELGAGHTVTVLYEIIPAGVENRFGSVDNLRYQQRESMPSVTNFSNELMTVKLRYKDPESDVSKRFDMPVANSLNRNPSADFKFAMSVAMFGQLLRDSDFKGSSDYQKVIALAREGVGRDEQGYRKEFIRLAEVAGQLR